VAKSGGDFTTITAALNSIADASASNRYLVWVAPGVYTETVTMKPFVDIEGAGELTTKITFSGSASATAGTLLGANNAELRFLTVENTGGTAWAVAIFNSGTAPRLTHVTASASGGTNNIGVYNYASSSPTMTNVTASASG
jgi:pectin methylesterase-like acyl-CoA thioesterase